MKIHEYKNYEEYVKAQEEGVHNHPDVPNSINYEWIQYSDIEFIKNDIITPHFNELKIIPKYGVCHGAKLGKENKWFEEATGVDFIGTDIVMETNEETKLMQWDFHEIKEEWRNKFDIIYSNALDHSYDPWLALRRWTSCLSPDGICILEWSRNAGEKYSTHIDPFGASLQEYEAMINSIGGKVVSILNFESKVSEGDKMPKSFVTFSK